MSFSKFVANLENVAKYEIFEVDICFYVHYNLSIQHLGIFFICTHITAEYEFVEHSQVLSDSTEPLVLYVNRVFPAEIDVGTNLIRSFIRNLS